MMNVFPKRKPNPNESENPFEFRFAKNVGMRQHSDSNSITSLLTILLVYFSFLSGLW